MVKMLLLQVLIKTLKIPLKDPWWTPVVWPWLSILLCIPILVGTRSTSSQRRSKTQRGTSLCGFFPAIETLLDFCTTWFQRRTSITFLHYKHYKGKYHSTHPAYVHCRKKRVSESKCNKKSSFLLSVIGIYHYPLPSPCLLSQSSTFWPMSPITSSWMLTRCWPVKPLPWWVSADRWWPGGSSMMSVVPIA